MVTDEGTATAVAKEPSKKAHKPKAKAKVKKPKAKATKKSNGEGRGRASAYAGKTLTKATDEPNVREGSSREADWKRIKSGMTYEKFIANGGNAGNLNFFVKAGKVKAK